MFHRSPPKGFISWCWKHQKDKDNCVECHNDAVRKELAKESAKESAKKELKDVEGVET